MPGFDDLLRAAERIAPFATATPVLENPELNERLGRRVLLKAETFQRTGSFKFRGAMNFLSQLSDAERDCGVVAFSSGNHAQGVAAAASILGIAATIVMPKDAPAAKIAGTKRYGARVIFYDRLSDDREAIAAAVSAQSGARLVRPFDDPWIMAGQGTAGLEFARQAREAGAGLSALLVPCSGGGLATGVGIAFQRLSPSTKIYAVEPEGFDGMGRSLAEGRRVTAPGGAVSMADALMSPFPGVTPFAAAKTVLAGGLTATDAQFALAVAFAAKRLKLVVEPGGSAGLAALLAGCISGTEPVGVVLSGGNCDLDLVMECARRYPEI